MLTKNYTNTTRISTPQLDRNYGGFIIFIINPILALFSAIKNYKNIYSKNIIWFFVVFYGLTMVSIENSDSIRYMELFIENTKLNKSFSGFIEIFSLKTTNSIDIFEPLISFIISRLTTNPHILFGAFGLIFGYFYSRNIWYLLNIVKSRIDKKGVFLIFIFAIIIGFWQINGFRFWASAHIFFYGTIRYLVEQKKNGLIYVISSVFLHFAFVLPVVTLFVYLLIGNRTNYYFVFFVLTLFISELNLDNVQVGISSIAPDLFQQKIDIFTNVDYVDNIKSDRLDNRNWRYFLYPLILKWSAVAFLVASFFIARNKKLPNFLINILSFTLFFSAISNIVSIIPSGGRFLIVDYLFVFSLAFILIQSKYKTKLMLRIFYITAPFLAFYSVGIINSISPSFGSSIVTNPIFLLFYTSETPLVDLF